MQIIPCIKLHANHRERKKNVYNFNKMQDILGEKRIGKKSSMQKRFFGTNGQHAKEMSVANKQTEWSPHNNQNKKPTKL